MKAIPFDPSADFAPFPFDQSHLELAREMKVRGLPWKPHVGCFVWDPEKHIEAESPFPLRIYFILSLPRFVNIFGSIDQVAEKLVWLPTWHQARLLALSRGVDPAKVSAIWTADAALSPGQELLFLYRLIAETL